MADKAKTLCKWKSGGYLDDADKFKKIVKKAKFACDKCGRVAADKKWLCKPVKLS